MVAFSDRKSEFAMYQAPRADDISDHIKRAYAGIFEEKIPDRFTALLTRLREMDEEKGPEDAS